MTQARYDEVADFYQAGFSETAGDPVLPALLHLLGDPRGRRILDVACGHGRISRLLAGLGAEVTGVDLSAALIRKATAAEASEPLGISYLHADVSAGDWLAGPAFDSAVCNFGLSDIDDLDGALASVCRAVRPGGRFVFSILHPCFGGGRDVAGAWPADGGYYDERWWRPDNLLSGLRRQVGANHRMLSTYFNALRRHGLPADQTAEPGPAEDWAAARPDCRSQPLYLVVRCIRQAVP
jgi:SAM-dependent methyltransferase